MRPKAKMNLHQCEYHLNSMKKANNSEEFEICFVAFVISARTVTFVLQKEYSGDSSFKTWYSKKVIEMKGNHICSFFHELRNRIEKEGINALEFSLFVNNMLISAAEYNLPENSSIEITQKGIFILINKGSSKEDLIPVKVNADYTVRVFLRINGQPLNVLDACEQHYQFLKDIVEEWTGKINEV